MRSLRELCTLVLPSPGGSRAAPPIHTSAPPAELFSKSKRWKQQPPPHVAAASSASTRTRTVHPISAMPTAVVIPLYIYPLPGAWAPLVEAAKRNPAVPFIAVVNPNNGPGADALPDASYQAALAELCAVPNMTLLGYVHCTWCRRSCRDIKENIDTYAAWRAKSGGAFGVSGVFIDETPWEPKDYAYMRDLAKYIRKAFDGKGFVVYNPGVVVDQRYLEDADLVVVFEQSHQEWYAYFLAKGLEQIPYNLRAKCVAMVHSFGQLEKSLVPASSPTRSTRSTRSTHGQGGLDLDDAFAGGPERAATALTDQITQLGLGGLFLTEQVGGYSRFPKTWDTVTRRLTETQTRTNRI